MAGKLCNEEYFCNSGRTNITRNITRPAVSAPTGTMEELWRKGLCTKWRASYNRMFRDS